MKATIQHGPAKPRTTRFKAGEIIITGHGSVALLTKDHVHTDGELSYYTAIVFHSPVRPELQDGRIHSNLYTSSGKMELFTGQVTLENK